MPILTFFTIQDFGWFSGSSDVWLQQTVKMSALTSKRKIQSHVHLLTAWLLPAFKTTTGLKIKLASCLTYRRQTCSESIWFKLLLFMSFKYILQLLFCFTYCVIEWIFQPSFLTITLILNISYSWRKLSEFTIPINYTALSILKTSSKLISGILPFPQRVFVSVYSCDDNKFGPSHILLGIYRPHKHQIFVQLIHDLSHRIPSEKTYTEKTAWQSRSYGIETFERPLFWIN